MRAAPPSQRGRQYGARRDGRLSARHRATMPDARCSERQIWRRVRVPYGLRETLGEEGFDALDVWLNVELPISVADTQRRAEPAAPVDEELR